MGTTCYCRCEKGRVEQTRTGRKRTRGRTNEAKIKYENNNKNDIKGIKAQGDKKENMEDKNRIRGERVERSEGSENVIVKADPPIKTNSYSRHGHSSVFVQ